MLLAFGLVAGGGGGYWYARTPHTAPISASMPPAAAHAADRVIVYYRDPGGAPSWSAEPTKDSQGRDYLPVYADEEVSFDAKPQMPMAAQGERKIRFYRNPMGLPDTSPVPKKDWMGMDYIPVYEDDEQDDGTTVKVSLDRIQRSGVRTEAAEARVIVRPVRAVGSVKRDETRLTVVAMRSEGYVEELFVSKTGQHVRAGEPLFRVYSPEIQRAQIDLLVAMRSVQRGVAGVEAERSLEGARQRLRNLGVPEDRIREVRETGANPRTLDWPSPATGDVIEKRVINGQRVSAGDELYRIADHSHIWVIADVAESDLAEIGVGTHATVNFRAYPMQPAEGVVTLIYPEMKTETRTARIRIELPNPEGRLKPDMYADVVFRVGADAPAVVAVPLSAVIDSGSRQAVLIAKGEGRFEPRAVKLGRRDDDHVEIIEGVAKGEEIVTTATFLIDAESNLRAALKTFTQPEPPK